MTTTGVWLQTTDSTDDNNGTVLAINAVRRHPDWAAVLIVVACSVIMIGTVLGNTLVCVAVSIVRKLRTPSNWLIVSLALADLLVALIVMPLAVVYEIEGRWLLGEALCDMWTFCDVMLCTASILNLCMISVDRYFVISQPFAYAVKRTPAKMAAMILGVWTLSAVITIPLIVGRKDGSEEQKPNECHLSQKIGYQIYATLGAFYLPLIIMIVIYYRIYVLSARIHRSELRSKPSTEALVRRNTSAGSKSSFDHNHPATHSTGNHRPDADNGGQTSPGVEFAPHQHHHPHPTHHPHPKRDAFKRNVSFLRRPTFHRLSISRERKATKTLGVIMGAFTACWLPFFIVALIRPFLGPSSDLLIPRWLDGLLQWLGFANSFFNPIIYARFNRDFRTPFKEILFFRCSDINNRVRSESYTEQFGGDGASSGGGGWHRGSTVAGRNRTGSVIENSVFAAEDDDGGGPEKEAIPSSASPPEKNGNGSCSRSASVNKKQVKICY